MDYYQAVPPEKPSSPHRRVWRSLRVGLLGLSVVAALALYSTDWGSALGSSVSGARLERVQRSKHYRDGGFVNSVPTPMLTGSTWTMLERWLFEATERQPASLLSFAEVDGTLFHESPRSGLRLTWLGHSTVLIEIDGQRVLTDPIFSERASPSTWLGPRRFFVAPLEIEQMPTLDAVVISHDHYDHLDHRSIQELAPVTQKFFVPLGVAAHLEGWGVEASQIVELDWWQSATHAGLEFTATPARHFSGRRLGDRNSTQWASWAIVGPSRRVFFSGDTGYFGGFQEIGERLGPFDASLLESGAYDVLWPHVHLGPENVLKAHRDLRARLLLPVHWGTFNLAIHAWTEPIERLRQLTKASDVALAQPFPGESFELDGPLPASRWWQPVRTSD